MAQLTIDQRRAAAAARARQQADLAQGQLGAAPPQQEFSPFASEVPQVDQMGQLRQAPPSMSAPTGTFQPAPAPSYDLAQVPGQALQNLPASAKQFASGVYEAVTSPFETAKGAWDLLAGGMQNILPKSAKEWIDQFDGNPAAGSRAVEMANAAGGMFKDRYGSYDNIKRTLAEDPVGAAADLSTLFTGGALLTAKAAPNISQSLSRAATVTDPLSVVTKPAQQLIETKQRILPSALRKEQEANAVRDATLRAAQGEGYVVTPGSVSPTGKNIIAERLAGKTYLEQLASVKNQEVTNNLSRRAVGLPKNAPLTSDAMQTIRAQEYAKGYEPINKIGRVGTDPAFLDDLIQIEAKYKGSGGSFPDAVPANVENLVKKYVVDGFEAADAVKATQTLRAEAKAAFRRGDQAEGLANLGVANALENQIERAIMVTKRPDTPNLLEQFRLSRQRMAVSHTIEDAIVEGGGSVRAAKLARDLQSGKYVSGDIETIASFANVFPRVSQLPSQFGTPAAGTMIGNRLLGGSAGGAGLGALTGAGGLETVGLALGGAALTQGIPAALRSRILSPGGQRNLLDYRTVGQKLTSDTAARNALLMYQTQQAAQAGDRQVRELQPNELGALYGRENQNQLAR